MLLDRFTTPQVTLAVASKDSLWTIKTQINASFKQPVTIQLNTIIKQTIVVLVYLASFLALKIPIYVFKMPHATCFLRNIIQTITLVVASLDMW